jgi:uncharacterized cupin superfamily protein
MRYNLRRLAEEKGEYVLGLKDLGTHAVYAIYGLLRPGEKDRKAHPGEGHEEILCAIKGEITVVKEGRRFRLKEGHAFHLKSDDVYYLENDGSETCHYFLAGGHVMEEHH